ncbi:MAG: cobyric acid synthase CobQ [Sulfurimonas sp. RIFOXYD12_FULL_33_39]|uniref:cobyric acid synthase n=1 Tax=unclassified Sulfurimonas TaxID=2623549 RepID=UPI0008D287F9|nr:MULTISPECIES: cobyric acid synthase [unclassified Sulfurimonas]OHE07478.1 MAG: cobyric acid synthase CobQ [Sulfurimonas sp. RIFCSPLOWO2_12_FULL_34_6]OHE10802.1 MAG: cobyric acid synthase CobQ [Sulfurimonas sp. RIFOXYD12_FULL_33_39]OHE13428.1 MAG: cobyric acid synthase CobQ [Sulfurimonas sp. RIFOXYD2_FULL_34_21]
MNSLSIFGTSSDAGKSILSFAITYLLHHRGISVAPFKAQNVSNNSHVTDEMCGEIAIPQHFAAEAIGLKTTPYMNPVLLKSGGASKAHMILNGKSVANKDVWEYYRDIDTLKPVVKEAFLKLKEKYDVIVAEGAGSPVELNLMDKDLSNIYIADEFNTKIILVADIQRGGVFASIYGVYNLLPKKLQKNVIGVIVNKFQGDMSLFDEGRVIIEKEFGIKVLGVVPFKPFNLGFEDSESIMNYVQDTSKAIIKVGVIKLPHISNFTDFEPLVADKEIELTFVSNAKDLSTCDVIVLPGSKRVVDDLAWLRERGFEKILKSKKQKIVAICGGYEMMFERILDPEMVESELQEVFGFGRIKGDVIFAKEKIVKKGCYHLFGEMICGYEIHNGVAKKRCKSKKNLYATFVHGIFESDEFRHKLFSEINPNYKGYNFKEHKAEAIKEFAGHIELHVDMDFIENELSFR